MGASLRFIEPSESRLNQRPVSFERRSLLRVRRLPGFVQEPQRRLGIGLGACGLDRYQRMSWIQLTRERQRLNPTRMVSELLGRPPLTQRCPHTINTGLLAGPPPDDSRFLPTARRLGEPGHHRPKPCAAALEPGLRLIHEHRQRIA